MSASDPTNAERQRRFRERQRLDLEISDWLIDDMYAQMKRHVPYVMRYPGWLSREEWGAYIDREARRRERRDAGKPAETDQDDES